MGEAGTSSAIAPRSARKHWQAKRGFAIATIVAQFARDPDREHRRRWIQRSLRDAVCAAIRRSRALAMLASSMPGSQTLASDPRTADPDPGIRDRRSWDPGITTPESGMGTHPGTWAPDPDLEPCSGTGSGPQLLRSVPCHGIARSRPGNRVPGPRQSASNRARREGVRELLLMYTCELD